MINDTKRIVWAATVYLVIAMMFGGCNPAGRLLEEADQLAAEGKYDEAIAMYQDLAQKYPGKDEASAASIGIRGCKIIQIGQLFSAGDYEACGRLYISVTKMYIDPEAAADAIWEGTGVNCILAADYVVFRDAGMTDENLSEMVAWLGAQKELMPQGLRDEASGWLCEHRAKFPAYVTCRNADPDIDGLDEVSPALGVPIPIEAGARWESVEDACDRLSPLTALCSGEAKDDVLAIVGAKSVEQLGRKVEAMTAEWEAAVEREQIKWEKEVEREAKDLRRNVERLGRDCDTWERQRASFEKQMQQYALANRMDRAMPLVPRHDALVEKINDNEQRLDELTDEVAAKDWPDAAKESVVEAIKKAAVQCD